MDGERDELVDRQTDVWLVGKLADWLSNLSINYLVQFIKGTLQSVQS